MGGERGAELRGEGEVREAVGVGGGGAVACVRSLEPWRGPGAAAGCFCVLGSRRPLSLPLRRRYGRVPADGRLARGPIMSGGTFVRNVFVGKWFRLSLIPS